jgi:hypothetical protein
VISFTLRAGVALLSLREDDDLCVEAGVEKLFAVFRVEAEALEALTLGNNTGKVLEHNSCAERYGTEQNTCHCDPSKGWRPCSATQG